MKKLDMDRIKKNLYMHNSHNDRYKNVCYKFACLKYNPYNQINIYFKLVNLNYFKSNLITH